MSQLVDSEYWFPVDSYCLASRKGESVVDLLFSHFKFCCHLEKPL